MTPSESSVYYTHVVGVALQRVAAQGWNGALLPPAVHFRNDPELPVAIHDFLLELNYFI